MRKGERQFFETKYARMSEKCAAERMLALNYRQVSRRFGHAARVDVSDEKLLAKVGVPRYNPRVAVHWYDFYRRCVSEDVITGVPDSIMSMIRNPDRPYVPPGSSDEEFIEMIVALGLVSG